MSGRLHRLHNSPPMLAAMLATAVAIPAAVIAGALAFWLLPHDQPTTAGTPGSDVEPVLITPIAETAETATQCRALLTRLPSNLHGPERKVRAHDSSAPARLPVAEYAAAWGRPAVVLRCGVSSPAALTPSAQLIGVNGVEWFANSKGTSTVWTTTSLPVRVEVTVPQKYQLVAATRILNPLAAPLLATFSEK